MTRQRHALRALVAIGLVVQLIAIVLTPIALWAHDGTEPVALCTCPAGDEATCPMHHQSSDATKICVMRSASEHGTLLTSLLTLAVPVPTSVVILDLPGFDACAVTPEGIALARSIAPDPPPPRTS